jgi:hypothetical protein
VIAWSGGTDALRARKALPVSDKLSPNTVRPVKGNAFALQATANPIPATAMRMDLIFQILIWLYESPGQLAEAHDPAPAGKTRLLL